MDIKDDMDDVCIDEVMEEEWFVRDNIEIDEKLPQLAQEVIRRNINYTDDGEASTEQMIEVLHDELDSFTDMTVEEIEYTILKLETACILTSMNRCATKQDVLDYETEVIEQEIQKALNEMVNEGDISKIGDKFCIS